MKPGLLKYPGGKSYLADRIVRRFGSRWSTYVEPFLGGGAVLLALAQSRPDKRLVGADVDTDLIALWQTVQDGSEEFFAHVEDIPYTEAAFEWWKSNRSCETLDRALRCLVTHRFSRGGDGKSFAWSDRMRGGRPGDVNAWESFVRRLPKLYHRIEEVEFLCEDALKLIPQLDSPTTLFYLDPPYLHATRVSKELYAYEMTRAQHAELLALIKTLQGRVLLSGYASDLYDQALAGWERTVWDMPCHQGQSAQKSRRGEVLWENRREQ